MARVLSWLRHHLAAVFAVTTVIFAALWLWDVEPAGRARRWQLGTFAEATGGVAAAITLGYLVIDRRRQLRRAEDEATRAQAQLITAWCVGATTEPPDKAHDDLRVTYALEVHNGSDAAVYSVRVSVGTSFDEPGWFVGAPSERFNVLGPHASASHTTMVGYEANAVPSFPPPVLLAFTDAGGRPWWRHPDGRLQEMGRHFRESLVDPRRLAD